MMVYEKWRDIIYVSGKLEYYNGNIEFKKLSNGMIMVKPKKGKRSAIAVWKDTGYVVWVWDGAKWTKYVDLRLKYGLEFLDKVKEIRKIVALGV